MLNIRPTRLRPFPLMPPEIAHTDKYSKNICFCCREIFFNLIYSPFFWRTGSFVEENWGVKFVSTHQPAGKRALCAKYSTHTKNLSVSSRNWHFHNSFGIFKTDLSLHQNFLRHGLRQWISVFVFSWITFCIQLPSGGFKPCICSSSRFRSFAETKVALI